MNKLITTLTLLLIISGCQFISQQPIKTSADYKQGIQGLSLRFVEKPAITEIYENSQFSLNLLLENRGAHDIENGIILLGFEDQNFRFINSDFTVFRLEGKSIYYPKGNQKLNSFQLESRKIEEKESMERKTHLYLTTCYDYKTEFSQNICIDSDVYNLKKDKVCTPQNSLLSGGQGAPVTVTEIETRMLFKSQENAIQPQFTIHLKNRGDGNIININNIHDVCSSQSIETEELSAISLEAEIFSFNGNIQLNCKPENPIKIKEKNIKVICISPETLSAEEGTYLSPLHITLDYGYTTTISKDITIKRLLT